MGGARSLNGSVYLGGIEMKVVCQLKIRRSLSPRERELEKHDDVHGLQHSYL
jgi:hypothetical protein